MNKKDGRKEGEQEVMTRFIVEGSVLSSEQSSEHDIAMICLCDNSPDCLVEIHEVKCQLYTS